MRIAFVLFLAGAALTACGGSTSAPVTVNDPPPPTATVTPPPAAPVDEAKATASPPIDEKLVCHRSLPMGGTADLYLKWDGEDGSGVLKTTGASGNVTVYRVRAEREGGLTVVDALGSTDPGAHVAVLRDANGKRQMYLHEAGPGGAPCENP